MEVVFGNRAGNLPEPASAYIDDMDAVVLDFAAAAARDDAAKHAEAAEALRRGVVRSCSYSDSVYSRLM